MESSENSEDNSGDASAVVINLVDGDNVITVEQDTTYSVYGNSEGQLIFKNGTKNALNIRIILNGINIQCTTSAPIAIFDDLNAIITLAEGTNTLSDPSEHSVYYKKSGKTSTNADDDKVNGCLYAQKDLTINGSGTLNINSNYKNGISSKGVLTIENGTLVVVNNADGAGIKGKDAVVIKGGAIDVTAKMGDGINTDTEADDKTIGYVYIENATIDIDASDDGISADTLLYIKSGVINVKTNKGAPSNITESSSDRAEGKGLKVGRIDAEIEDSDGNVTTKEITDVSYYKLVIDGGTITLNCNDDAIHSNGYLYINGGEITITTGDDAIHSDEYLLISGGECTINNCYEGIEAAQIEIIGGKVTLTAQDDGVNAANSNYSRNYDFKLIISGGDLFINAKGDGLDSNGYISISGGRVYVDGPTSNGDAALDSEKGILITGGIVVAVGSSGMVETPSSSSTQNVLSYACQNTISAGSTFSIVKDGEVILEFSTAKSCQSIIASCPLLKTNETYSLRINDTEVTSFTISSVITSIGTQTGPGGGRPGGGRPGWGF